MSKLTPIILFTTFITHAHATLVPAQFGTDTPLPNARPTMRRNSCRSVDLSANVGPVREQIGDSCYAFVATDLINYGQPTQLSALYLAQSLNPQTNSGMSPRSRGGIYDVPGLNQGLTEDALNAGLNGGMCPESAMPSINADYRMDSSYSTILDYYNRASSVQCRQLEPGQLQSAQLADLSRVSTELRRKYEIWQTLAQAVRAAYPGFDISKLENIFRQSQSRAQFFRALAAEACRDKLVTVTGRHPNVKNILEASDACSPACFNPSRRAELLRHVNQTLAAGRPVAIEFELGGLIAPPGQNAGAHMGMVSGRVWKNEERDASGQVTTPAGCYFLVKNSWGEDWRVPNGVKARAAEGKPGYFLMSEKSFLEHVHGTASLD